MVNESDHSSKDDATIERYVREKLGAGGAGFNLACMTFNEEMLYPLDQGLNKVWDMQKFLPCPAKRRLHPPLHRPQATIDELVRFISSS